MHILPFQIDPSWYDRYWWRELSPRSRHVALSLKGRRCDAPHPPPFGSYARRWCRRHNQQDVDVVFT